MTKELNISKRALNTPSSATRKLAPLALAAEKRGIKIYKVNIGQPDLPTSAKIMDFIRNFNNTTLEYAPSTGMPETVSAWSDFFKSKKYSFEKENIIVTSGGSEGLIFAFYAVCDPNDEIIVFEPFYTSYAVIAGMGNINLKAIKTSIKDGFHLPEKNVIKKAISKKTKAIILCNPNNPTGTLYRKEEIEMIVKIAKENNLFIISDETYSEIVFDGKKVTPFSGFSEILNQLIVVDSVSKRFNACGARVGCVASKNKDVISSVLKFAQSRLSVATIDQLSVVSLLKNHRSYVESVRKEYEKRRDIVVNEIKKIQNISFRIPEGAFYIILELPIDDSDKFAKFLLEKFSHNNETVMVAPATGFYRTPGLGKKEIRIAYVLNEKNLKKSMDLLSRAIKVYNQD